MLKTVIDDDDISVVSAEVQSPHEDDVPVILCSIAEGSGINIQDLVYFADKPYSVIWEKLKAAGILPEQITQRTLQEAKNFQAERDTAIRQRWHEENEAGCSLITTSTAFGPLDPAANPGHAFFRKIATPGYRFSSIMQVKGGGRPLNLREENEMPRSKASAAVLLPYKDVVELFYKAGLKNAESWSKEKLLKKLSTVDVLFTESMFDEDEEELKDLYMQISQAIEEGEELEVDMDEAVDAPIVEKKKKKGFVKTKVKKAPSEKKEKKEGKGRGGVAGVKRVGVVDTIITLLQKATERKPITKPDILKVLTDKFGPGTEADKDPKGMQSTVNTQISTKLKDRGISVHKNDKGFWADKED